MKITDISVDRPIATLMFFLGSLLLGLIAIFYMQIDLLPDIEPPVIQVLTTWRGATAEDVEAQVTKYIEETLSSVPNLEEISSRSKDNLSIVTCKFNWQTDLDEAANDVRGRLEWITRFLPDDAEKPMIFKFSSSEFPILLVTITAKENWQRLFQLVDKEIVDPLKRIPGVGTVYPDGGVRRQIIIRLNPYKLKSYNIPLSAIEQSLSSNNIDFPSGSIKAHTKEIYVKVLGQFKSIDEIKNLIVINNNGTYARLRDIAEVEDGFAKMTRYIYSDEGPAVIIHIQKQAGANTVAVSKKAIAALKEISKRLPKDVKISIIFDNSEFITNSIRNLRSSLIVGGILVIVVTVLFLRSFWSSLIIATAIPYSLLMTFFFMYLLGYTINTISLSSLIISIGMVVDNSIVSLEMIKRLTDEGKDYRTASKSAIDIIGLAISASTFTTIIVFLPLIFTSGITGILFKQLAITVSISLIMSLISAITLVPMLSLKLLKREREGGKIKSIGEKLIVRVEEYYGFLISRALEKPKQVLIVCLIIFVLSLFLIPFIGSEFIPKEDTGEARVFLRLPIDTNVETTLKISQDIWEFAKKNIPEIMHSYLFCGQSEQGFGEAFGFEEGAYAGGVGLRLVPKTERKRSSQEIADILRNEVNKIPELDWAFASASSFMQQAIMGGMGKPLVVDIMGTNLKDMRKAVSIIEEKLRNIAGVVDISSTVMPVRTQMNFKINEDKAPLLGTNSYIIGDSLRAYIEGKEIGKFRQDNEDIPIVLKLQNSESLTFEDVKALSVPTFSGSYQNILNLTNLIEDAQEIKIEHKNRARLYQVSANLEGISLGDAVKEFKRIMETVNLPSSVNWKISGEYEEQVKAFRALFILLIIGVIFVYMIMAAQFESLKHPFYIMFSVPFSFSGVLLLLFLTNQTINLMSFIGMVMLIGIVVNNSIVYIDYVNKLRAKGLEVKMALIEGGKKRLRPILMTWLTTVFGILPLAINKGVGSEAYNSLGIAALGGLLTSTIISLILIPAIYFVGESKKIRNESISN